MKRPCKPIKNYDKKRQITQPKLKENPPKVNTGRLSNRFLSAKYCGLIQSVTNCLNLFQFPANFGMIYDIMYDSFLSISHLCCKF
ncbi:hypothetical protein SB48_HM08orf05821 [Heyndrickxia coagulans]|uniref:Uncharacterized protein n=1 Tax=Heyndrickxia coagulans TaxID=1398 RepID=A0AAN0T7V5_HEYCO|nr:hypothetical protein SB48_HM08orf05821 [Heyndrickxia coagulans]